jgi:hypothetical protein
MKQKYPQYKYGGSIYNLLRKLKYRNNKGVIINPPEKIFVQRLIMLDPKHIDEAIDDICSVVSEMMKIEEGVMYSGCYPPHNRTANAGYFGNSKDPYFDVIYGRASLMDEELFMDREDTYATEVAVEE